MTIAAKSEVVEIINGTRIYNLTICGVAIPHTGTASHIDPIIQKINAAHYAKKQDAEAILQNKLVARGFRLKANDSIDSMLERLIQWHLDPSVSKEADALYNKGVEAGIANCPAATMIAFMDKNPDTFFGVVYGLKHFPLNGRKISDVLFDIIEMMEASNGKGL